MSEPLPHCPALVLVRQHWRPCDEVIRDGERHCPRCRGQRARAIEAGLDWDAQQAKLHAEVSR